MEYKITSYCHINWNGPFITVFFLFSLWDLNCFVTVRQVLLSLFPPDDQNQYFYHILFCHHFPLDVPEEHSVVCDGYLW